MATSKHVVCISTSKPSSSLTANGGGGSLTVLDPQTGTILSSARASTDLSGKQPLGMSSLSELPEKFSAGVNTRLVMAYGGSAVSKNNKISKADNHAMLISIRSGPAAPIIHWKSRAPEASLSAGLSVSPCGTYVIGGGSSGSLYIWRVLGGELLRTIKAHYRSCSCLLWSDCSRYLVTGGQDGMVHVFSLLDLIDKATAASKRQNASPLRTWTVHTFPVTDMMRMGSDRIAVSAEDGRVIVLELFSSSTVATLKFPHGIGCLVHHGGRLYAGSNHGIVYSVDMDAYAIHQTQSASGAALTRRRQSTCSKSSSIVDQILNGATEGVNADNGSSNNKAYQSQWFGHEHPVTSIAIIDEDSHQRLITGDELGEVRIWDVESRTCVHVLRPWSSSVSGASLTETDNTKKAQSKHPIVAMTVILQPSEAPTSSMFGDVNGAGSNHKGKSSVVGLVTPLQRYVGDDSEDSRIPVPFLLANRSRQNLEFWEPAQPLHRKRRLSTISSDEVTSGTTIFRHDNDQELDKAKSLIQSLQEELQTKKDEVQRWEKINNKLMAKLSKSGNGKPVA